MARVTFPDERREALWVPASAVATPHGHPFYRRLNEIRLKHDFDTFVEGLCVKFYKDDEKL